MDIGSFGSQCNCARPSQHATAAARPASAGRFKRSLGGGALAVCGMLGWLCVPKCPLCLAAYLALGSGITLSFAQSQLLRQLLFVVAAGLILAGAWRIGRHAFLVVRQSASKPA